MQEPHQQSRMQQWLLALPLGRVFTYANLFLFLLLFITLSLGIRQYLLYQRCSVAVATSESLHFRFSALQQYLSSAIITEDHFDLERITKATQEVSQQINGLRQNVLVPEAVKAYLVSQKQMMQLLVRLQQMQDASHWNREHAAGIILLLNDMSSDIQQMRMELTEYTQNILAGLHKIIIGCLAFFVALSAQLLFCINYSFVSPIQCLARQVRDHNHENDQSHPLQKNISLQNLIDDTLILLQKADSCTSGKQAGTFRSFKQYQTIALATQSQHAEHGLNNLINGVLNYTQQLIDLDTSDKASLPNKILTSLRKEEGRLARLIRCLRKCTHSNTQPPLPLSDFLETLQLTLVQSMKAEGLRFEITGTQDDIDQAPPMNPHIWLICITLLEYGRASIEQSKDPEARWLKLTITHSGTTLQFDNGANSWVPPIDGEQENWPTLELCQQWAAETSHQLSLPANQDSHQIITLAPQ